MRSIQISVSARRARGPDTTIDRDFANARDRLRRLDSGDSDARLTFVQRSAPVESTLQQELTRVRADTSGPPERVRRVAVPHVAGRLIAGSVRRRRIRPLALCSSCRLTSSRSRFRRCHQSYARARRNDAGVLRREEVDASVAHLEGVAHVSHRAGPAACSRQTGSVE